MNGSDQLTAFLSRVRSDPELQRRLSTFQVEKWGEAHLPLDIDLDAVIALAAETGFHFDRCDVVASQCQHLERFASFEAYLDNVDPLETIAVTPRMIADAIALLPS